MTTIKKEAAPEEATPNQFNYNKSSEPVKGMRYDQCEWCGREIENDDYMYDTHVICKGCLEYAESHKAIRNFIEAFPDKFFRYLKDGDMDEVKIIYDMLEDYRSWELIDFDKWLNHEVIKDV